MSAGEPAQEPPPVIVGFVIVGAVRVLAVRVCVSLIPTIALAGGLSPPSCDAFRFVTCVVLATEKGAVPVLTVLVNWPLAESVVNAPLPGVVPPIAPGDANVAPFNRAAFRFGTTVVLAIERGAVPVATVDVTCLVKVSFPVKVIFAAGFEAATHCAPQKFNG